MTYDSGTQFDLTGTANISIPIYQESKFDTSTVEVAPASINVGSQSNLMFSIYNIGKTDLYNVQVQFEADSIENNMAFVGNLASGATGNVDVMLTGVSPTMDDGTIKIKISYEDEAGNVTEVDKSANLYVNEIMMEEFDDMGESGRRDGEESESGGNKGAIIRGLIIGLVALAVIGGGIFLSVRKKKKREAFLHEEDLRDLEELEAEEEKVSDNASAEASSDDKASDNNGASGNSDGV